jgi:hypothetical protein
MIVRCTARLLNLLRERPQGDVEPGGDDWYLNLLWLDRGKCLLLVHAATLFPVLTADVQVAHLRLLGHWVAARVCHELASEQLSPDALGLLAPDDAVIAKTTSRRVLGIMNDMGMHIEYAANDVGGLANLDVPGVNRALRRGLHTPGRDYARPLDLTLERLGATRAGGGETRLN